MSRFILKFIGGKYEGGEVALPDAGEVGIGRAQELAICLVEDMVSRHHAKIEMGDFGIVLTDLNSTNGTFVNGERVAKCELEADDRVLIGTSILRLVDTGAVQEPQSQQADEAVTHTAVAPVAAPPEEAQPASNDTMAGDLADVAIADLLQLLGGNGRTGEIRLESLEAAAVLTLRQGALHKIVWQNAPSIPPIKALCRVMTLTEGTFAFTAQEPTDTGETAAFTGRLEEVLIEATRQNDEATRLREPFGVGVQNVRLAKPLGGRLADLDEAALDVLQTVWDETPSLDALLDAYVGPDSEMLAVLTRLRQGGFISTSQA